MRNIKQLVNIIALLGLLVALNQRMMAATSFQKIPPAENKGNEELTEKKAKAMLQRVNNNNTSKWFWDFDSMNDSEGWIIPKQFKGAIMGGAIWLSVQRDIQNRIKKFLSAILSSPLIRMSGFG